MSVYLIIIKIVVPLFIVDLLLLTKHCEVCDTEDCFDKPIHEKIHMGLAITILVLLLAPAVLYGLYLLYFVF